MTKENTRPRSNMTRTQWAWKSVAATVVLYFIINSTFRYSPFLPNALELGILLSLLLLLTFTRYRFPRETRSLVIYTLTVMVYILVVPAIVASYVHDQSVILGLAANRAAFLVMAVICFAFLVFSNRITLKSVEISLITLAWLNMAIGVIALQTLDPNQFSPDDLGNFLNDGGGSHNKFNLPKGFTLAGAFYYFFQGFYLGKNKEKFYFLLMFSYVILGGNHRALLLSLIITVFFVVMYCKALRRGLRIKLFLKLSFSTAVILGAAFIFSPQAMIARMASFSDAFSVVSGAGQVDDWSAGARIEQFSIALSGIPQYPFFGHGNLSNSFNDGYSGLYGYFHPSDVGLIGVVFIFGVIGLLFLSYQYVFYFRFIRAALNDLRCRRDHSMLFAAMCMLLVHSVNSITSGMFAFYPERGLFWLFLIAAYLRSDSSFLASPMFLPCQRRAVYEA